MKKISSVIGNCRIETFGLTEEQHAIAVDFVTNNKRRVGNYTLDCVDEEFPNIWLVDAESKKDNEYADFLRNALSAGAEILTLNDHLGEFSQSIGDVAVYG